MKIEFPLDGLSEDVMRNHGHTPTPQNYLSRFVVDGPINFQGVPELSLLSN